VISQSTSIMRPVVTIHHDLSNRPAGPAPACVVAGGGAGVISCLSVKGAAPT
jgi:hypothetical protein